MFAWGEFRAMKQLFTDDNGFLSYFFGGVVVNCGVCPAIEAPCGVFFCVVL